MECNTVSRMPIGAVLVQALALLVVFPAVGVLAGKCTYDRTTGWRVERIQSKVQDTDEAINHGRTQALSLPQPPYAERQYFRDGRLIARDRYTRQRVVDAAWGEYRLVSREYYEGDRVIARDLLNPQPGIVKRREYFASDNTVFLWDEFGDEGIPLKKGDRFVGRRPNGTRSPLPPQWFLFAIFYR